MEKMPTIKKLLNKYNMHLLTMMILLLFGCKQPVEESLYVIPTNYKGAILVIFNQKNGEPAQYRNGKRLYKIPETGILKTQFKPNFGFSKAHFVYGNEGFTDVKYMTSQDWSKYPEDSDKVVCWNLETGVTQDSRNQKINFEVFCVGPINESEKISDEKGKILIKAFSAVN